MKRPLLPTALAIAVVFALPLPAQIETGPKQAQETRQTEETRQTQDTKDRALEQILEGGVPKTVADLRAMEAHTQKILAKVLPYTVSCGGATGVIVKDGHVLTCAHVTRNTDRSIPIILQSGRRLNGKSLGLNHRSDAGLVKIDLPPEEIGKLPCAEMGRVQDLKQGQWVVMLGHTGGRQTWRIPPLRFGRLLRIPTGGYLVSDCTMAAGDSGGPLFDMAGRVIGINSRINRSLQNNMHVPIDAFHDDWDKFVKGETIGRSPTAQRGSRGRFGRFGDQPRPVFGAEADTAIEGRAQIAKVMPGSPAAKAGICPGDVILSIGGRSVRTARALGRRLYRFQGGDKVKVEIRRGEEELEVEVTLERGPERSPERGPERGPDGGRGRQGDRDRDGEDQERRRRDRRQER